jgi:hypothetical protein
VWGVLSWVGSSGWVGCLGPREVGHDATCKCGARPPMVSDVRFCSPPATAATRPVRARGSSHARTHARRMTSRDAHA